MLSLHARLTLTGNLVLYLFDIMPRLLEVMAAGD
jgi:hypothetical protein